MLIEEVPGSIPGQALILFQPFYMPTKRMAECELATELDAYPMPRVFFDTHKILDAAALVAQG